MPPEFVRIEDYRPFWEAFRRDQEWTAFTGLLDGEPAWSDGHVLMLGDPPPSADTPQDAPLHMFDGPLEKAKRETLKPIEPLAVTTIGKYRVVVFSDGHIVDVRFWRLLNERWRHAIWLGDEYSHCELPTTLISPMAIRDGEKLVAVVMAMKTDSYADINAVLAELQNANRSDSKQSTEAEKSADQK